MTNSTEKSAALFSIGHSNHPLEKFLELLRHFNAEPLKAAVTGTRVKYLFLGRELGGRPEGERFYDEEGHVLYDQVARSPLFLHGVERLEKGAGQYRVAMMCSEENPAICHRHLLVARVLEERGVPVIHIRGDGRTQTDAEIAAESRPPDDRQLSLFDAPEPLAWKSLQPPAGRRLRQGAGR
jgi:hypothetical protein